MVKYTVPQFMELYEVLMAHFKTYGTDPNEYDILLNTPSKRNTVRFSLELARIRIPFNDKI
jgi:hypothetical protein